MAGRPTTAAWRRARLTELRAIAASLRVIVGEWSTPMATNIFDDQHNRFKWRPREWAELPENDPEAVRRLAIDMARIIASANTIKTEAENRLRLMNQRQIDE